MGRRQGFRLEPVLRARRAAERAASLAAAEAESAAVDAARRVEELSTALEGRGIAASQPAPAFLAAMVAAHAAAADVGAARSLAQASAEHGELLRGRWTAAAQDVKALEKLRDRHLLALRRAEDAAESRAVDDLVTRRHAVRTDEGGEEPWRG